MPEEVIGPLCLVLGMLFAALEVIGGESARKLNKRGFAIVFGILALLGGYLISEGIHALIEEEKTPVIPAPLDGESASALISVRLSLQENPCKILGSEVYDTTECQKSRLNENLNLLQNGIVAVVVLTGLVLAVSYVPFFFGKKVYRFGGGNNEIE